MRNGFSLIWLLNCIHAKINFADSINGSIWCAAIRLQFAIRRSVSITLRELKSYITYRALHWHFLHVLIHLTLVFG